MELNLEVVLSSSIKRKKPWPRFCWLGQEKESVFLLDDKRISEINMVSGRTKKRTPKLHHLLSSVVTMSSSHNGLWLCGLMATGELFLWNKDKDLLKTTAAIPDAVWMITSGQGNPLKVSLQVSLDGMRVLLVTQTGQVFLWECQDVKDLTGLRDGPVKGRWAHIHSLENIMLPSSHDKEASQHTVFVKTEEMGDMCLSAFVFTFRKKLIITFLKIQWEEGHIKDGSIGYSIHWTTKTYSLSSLSPPCQPVKSRGALIPSFSPDGKLLAIVLNQRKPKATQVLFMSTQNFVTISRDLGGCGSKKLEIPSKYIRSYWVGNVSWSPGGLFLACVLKRGSLLMLARLGGLLTLSTSGCNIDFGPAQFLPLHPLVTYRPPITAGRADASLSSSSMSVRDLMRQRYSVTWHPQLMYLIVSDGYLATVTRVLDRPSPGLLLKALLKDIKVDLQKVSQRLDKLQAKAWLESVSPLNLDNSLEQFNSTVRAGPNTTDSVVPAAADGSTLPLFLQDQQALGGTKDLFESVQAMFEDESDVDGIPPGSHAEEGGRLEFASMFDTLHAIGSHSDIALTTSPDYERHSVDPEKKPIVYRDLKKIQSRLLTAWAFSMSLGDAIAQRSCLLRHMLCCMVRFAALLHFISNPVCAGESKTSSKLFPMIRMILSFLPWDSSPSKGPRCLGLIVELSKQLIHLLLTPLPDSIHCHLSSQILSQALIILQLVSESLDQTYNLQHKTYWCSTEKKSSQPAQFGFSDEYYVPLLQENDKKSSFVQPSQPQRPSSRLLGIYQMMYNVTKQYAEEQKNFAGCDGYEEEEQQLTVIISQIQAAVQAAGERLEEGATLLGYPGEQIFLSGSYAESVKIWQSQISEGYNKSGHRRAYQETRYCLALLYSLLSQYQLKEAQELGDHMAQLLLHRAGHLDCSTEDSLPCSWLPMDLHLDAACAVVETLGRFMASYFTNQPLYILPPHNVTVLPPLHLPHEPSFGRLVPLCQEEVARAVRQQHLSQVWTVDYAQDLLLLGGLLPEAVWLASNLGDWKTAVSLSLAYTNYHNDHPKVARLRRRDLHLPSKLKPESIFQTELECLLFIEPESKECKDQDGDRSLMVDLLDDEDWNVLRASLQEILKASVIAGVNVMSSPLSLLLDTAREICSSLPALVPTALYLPSPPLYCPQPSPNTQDITGTPGQVAEVNCRHKVSGILQRLLLLLRSGHCCHPAAQWYISHLRRARHLLHKIKTKYPYPSVPEMERTFPEGLMKFVTRSGYFRCGQNKDGNLDADTTQIITCFRELCALCWMLHVRDQLSISCRRYHAARQRRRDKDISADTEVNSSCAEALQWACRFLPFSHFLNAEEIFQDLLLSLVSEMPPLPLVADTLVQAFPDEEESIRVPLREKYNSLLERLRQCHVLEEEKEEERELMMVLIQDKYRQRKKHLGRLQRHIAPTVLHLWEKEDEEEDRGSKHGMAMLKQLSLGTSLSTSSLTDCRFPAVCSDGDTAENTSETISLQQQGRAKTRSKERNKVKGKIHANKRAVKTGNVMKEGGGDSKDSEQPSLPVVGTWEFELEDEEYLNFLELFLSYVLEKDSKDGGDSGNEPPFLSGFCSEIRERELHSLTFDVLTTIRRQRDGHHLARKHLGKDPPVFRAGCCYRPMGQDGTPELHPSSVCSETHMSRISLPATSQSGLSSGKQQGLFGLKKQSSVPQSQAVKNLYGSESIKSAFNTVKPSDISRCGKSVTVADVTELQQGLDPKLEAQFPKLARLLEWMVRWADRRVLPGHHGKPKKKRLESGGTANEGVVIRVKASAPAILTSLSLLEHRYAALLGTVQCSAHMQVPQVQCVLAPVLQPAMKGPLERESSVDTGYPGSIQTPINAVDDKVQQEARASGSHSAELEEVTFHKMNLLTDQDQLMSDDEIRQSDFEGHGAVTPEQVAGTEICVAGLEVLSSCFTENVSGNSCTPDTSLKLDDLDCSVKSKEMSSSSSHHCSSGSLHTPRAQDVSASPIHELKAAVSTEVSDSPKCLPNSTENPVRHEAQTSTPAAPSVDSNVPNQPSATESPAVRQRLGEDLFRLIEHINYMSLRDVLQASFSNVQSCTLAQSNVISSLHNVPSSSTANSIPETNATHIQPTISESPQTQKYVPKSVVKKNQVHQPTDCLPPHQPEMQSSVKTSSAAHQFHSNRITLPTASGASVNYQEMQPLTVQAGSPEGLSRDHRKLIPCSEGLLATTDSNHVLPSASVLLPPSGSAQHNSVPLVPGLKLLQLQRPVLPQLSVPQCASTQPPQTRHTGNPHSLKNKRHASKHNDKTTSVKIGRDKEAGFKKYPTFNTSHDPTPISPQHKFWPPDTIPPLQGLRLLRIHPELRISLPKLHLGSSSGPTTEKTSQLTETPVIKLLHINSGPKMILPLTPSVQMTRPMSVEELTSSAVERQCTEKTVLQLLSVEPANKSTTGTPASSLNSRKRRIRRENSTKAEVRFRPDATVIPRQEPAEVPVTEQPACFEATPSGEDISIPHELPDSFLTGQKLLDKAMTTSAELHAFAATCKRPVEHHDASTETDFHLGFVDKAVSAQISVPESSPNSHENFQIDNREPVQGSKAVHEPGSIQGLCGQQFLSVFDIKDTGYHQNLQPHPSSGPQEIPSACPTSPTSAHLHFLAASAITSRSSAAPRDVSRPSPLIPEDVLKPNTHSELHNPEKSPSLSRYEPMTVSEGSVFPPGHVTDDLSDSNVCRAIRNQSTEPRRAFSFNTGCFSSRLSELDAQLTALQNIADHLEKDYSNSKLLVNNIEKFIPHRAPDVNKTRTAKKTVRLSVPLTAWAPTPDPEPLTEMNVLEEDDEENEEMFEFDSFSSAFLYSPTVGPGSLHTPPSKKDKIPETDNIGYAWPEKNLSQSELSDTGLILDELVKEGYLSAADVDLTSFRTVSNSSQTQHSSHMPEEHHFSDDERRELRQWMRKKQRERLAVFQKHRKSLIEKEHKPFSSPSLVKSTNRTPKASLRSKEQDKKLKLLERYNQRTREACSLANNVLISSAAQQSCWQADSPHTAITTKSTSLSSAGNTCRDYSGSADNNKSSRSQSRQAQPYIRPHSAEVHWGLSDDYRTRLGLHRPASVLPKDRLSQVTKRGMLPGTKRPSEEFSIGDHRKIELNKTFSRGPAVKEQMRKGKREEERTELHSLQGSESGSVRFIIP